MQKILLVLSIVIICTSCEKSYKCVCKDPERGNEVIGQLDISSKYEGEASIKCTNRQIEYNNLAMYDYVSCNIED